MGFHKTLHNRYFRQYGTSKPQDTVKKRKSAKEKIGEFTYNIRSRKCPGEA